MKEAVSLIPIIFMAGNNDNIHNSSTGTSHKLPDINSTVVDSITDMKNKILEISERSPLYTIGNVLRGTGL